ncbi:MAG: phosphate acetyltransferase [Gammaproteobacteria bacterium]
MNQTKRPLPILLVPATADVDIYQSGLDLNDSLCLNNLSSIFFFPISEKELPNTISLARAEDLLLQNKFDQLLEEIVARYKNFLADQSPAFIVIPGCPLESSRSYATELNQSLVQALDAAVVLVTKASSNTNTEQMLLQLKILQNRYISNMPNRLMLGSVIYVSNGKVPEEKTTMLQEKYQQMFPDSFPLLLTAFQEKKQSDMRQKIVNFSSLHPVLDRIYEPRITPPVFCSQLIKDAQTKRQKIVLPEGDEPRTLMAASICAERGIAECILLGDAEKIRIVATEQKITLSDKLIILDPKKNYAKYLASLLEIRKGKGMTEAEAREYLQDPVVVGTMMLQMGEVDGLVSGAVHTTANTIRPALQIIKTQPDMRLVSSVFFMCLPEQVLLYADCAINPNPTAEELAEIALQTAESARFIGLPARVAMLSYSTGKSGFGPDVDKVVMATEIAKKRQPELAIEGPIQYDAAIDPDVAKLKLPNSEVAGRATILIFPDLDAGNIACKVAQRSANIVCIGPMLQGLRKPVNDLSRGCLVKDIVFTIALTAVQAQYAAEQRQKNTESTDAINRVCT